MSVRMALVKLAALGAAGALIGGGAVHMAEKAKQGAPHYVKHAPTCGVRHVHHLRHVVTTTTTHCGAEEASIQPQNPPVELAQGPEQPPMPGPYYTAYYASSGHRHHHHYYAPPPPPPPPTPVPAPPMLVLFGAAASALVARRMLAQRRAQLA